MWRIFPWDPHATDGAPFSARYVPSEQGSGRFDVTDTRVLYLAESPEHAAAEAIQPFRGRVLRDSHLERFGRRLALVPVTLQSETVGRLADLTDPAVLLHHGIRPDHLASADTRRTQAIARALYDLDLPGFRWWSSLSGDWHATILFLRDTGDDLTFGTPDPLSLDHPAVRAAAAAVSAWLPTRPGRA